MMPQSTMNSPRRFSKRIQKKNGGVVVVGADRDWFVSTALNQSECIDGNGDGRTGKIDTRSF